MPNKKYASDRKTCQVTFSLPAEVGAARAVLVGDFNEWTASSHQMRRYPSGRFSITLKLPAGASYHYRYLLDDERWENDWEADRYEPNAYGEENSVVDL